MPRVSPFTGLVFDESVVGPLGPVTAPPYDSISAEHERRLHSASPHNVVRLILGRDEPGDDNLENKYTRGARLLRAWREQGALRATHRPAWFLYEMRFGFEGRARRIRGVIAEVEIEPLGGAIVPHERTLPGPIEDRMRLLRTVRANLSPVYALYRGPQPAVGAAFDEAASTRDADIAVSDEQGVEHRLWIVPVAGPVGDEEAYPPPSGAEGNPPRSYPSEPSGLPAADVARSSIDRAVAGEHFLIADGHHRYAVAQAFRELMRSEEGPGPWDRMMMLLVDAATEDPPVLPIHRVLLRGDLPAAGQRVRDLAEVLATVDDDALVYGSATREGDGEIVHRVAHLDGAPPTVCALHEQVLGDAALRFQPDAAAAEEAVRLGEAPAAFFLPPTHVERIRAVIESGGTLPQKSTYFWPKPRTGMVIRPLE
jgi:uncharacterized protein (DUF1015 family)